MKNFDEIYKKICEENLKGDDYTVSINTNNLNNNNTKPHKNNAWTNKTTINISFICTILGIILISIFMIVWVLSYVYPNFNISIPFFFIIISFPFIGEGMIKIGQHLPNFRKNKKIFNTINEKNL